MSDKLSFCSLVGDEPEAHVDGHVSEKIRGKKSKQSSLSRSFFPLLTLTESQMIISAEIQLETLSAYMSSCWRDRWTRQPSDAGRLLPSAGTDTFLLGESRHTHQDQQDVTRALFCLYFCLYNLIYFYIVLSSISSFVLTFSGSGINEGFQI